MPVNGFSFDNGYEFGHTRVVEDGDAYEVVLTIYRRPHCVKSVYMMGEYPTKDMALWSARRLAERRQKGT